MDVSANWPARTAGPGSSLGLRGFGARRGGVVLASSPLPHHLQTTGVGWLVAVALVVVSVLVFAGGCMAWPSTSPWSMLVWSDG